MSSEGFRRLNIEIIGESGVGKTSLIERLVEGNFSEDIQSTSGICQWERMMWRQGMNILLIIREIPFLQSTRNDCWKLFCRSDAIIIVFSCGDRFTFRKLDDWISLIRSSVGNKYVCIIGTKSDLQNREVSSLDIGQYSDVSGVPAYETSALTGSGVRFAFFNLVDHLLNRRSSFSVLGRNARPDFENCVCPFPWPRLRPRSNRAATMASTATTPQGQSEAGATNSPAEEIIDVTNSSVPEPLMEAGDNQDPNIPVTGLRELPAPVVRPTDADLRAQTTE